MTSTGYDNVLTALRGAVMDRPLGHICAVLDGAIEVAGLGRNATIGDRVRIGSPSAGLKGEIVGAEGETVRVLPDGPSRGLRIGDNVAVIGAVVLSPDDSWTGRIVDPSGQPLDRRRRLA